MGWDDGVDGKEEVVEGCTHLYSKAVTVASEKGCFQKEVERAEGIVPPRVHPGWSRSSRRPHRGPWHSAGGVGWGE